MNFEDVLSLNTLILNGYHSWVNNAPPSWKEDHFLQNNSPILITSRYGQNASIVLPGNNSDEALAWNRERDYSKVAFLTFALATSIEYTISFLSSSYITYHLSIYPSRCYRIHDWDIIPIQDIKRQSHNHIYDDDNQLSRHRIHDIGAYPLLDEDGQEIPIFNRNGQRIERRLPLIDPDESQCGVLIKLNNIHALFNTPDQLFEHDDLFNNSSSNTPSHYIDINAYPIAFLRSAGNIQASGIPSCFLPHIADINKSIRQDPNIQSQHTLPSNTSDNSDDDMDIDPPQHLQLLGGQPVIKPVASQFYNYIAHRTATRAGNHDTMKGTVTAAIAGGFAQLDKHRRKAKDLMTYCDTALPSHRFKTHIDIDNCPSSCRAELVYSVDVRALRHPTGRYSSLHFSLHSLPLIPFLALSSIISFPLSQMLGTMKILFIP